VIDYLNKFEKVLIIEESFPSIVSNLAKKNIKLLPKLASLSVEIANGFIFQGDDRYSLLNITGLSENAILSILKE
jgi:hypothetical protein